MDSSAYPRSPDLSSYAPRSPEIAGLRPDSPDLGGLGSPQFGGQNFGHFPQQQRFQPPHQQTSQPLPAQYYPQQYPPPNAMPPQQFKSEDGDDDYMPDAAPTSGRRSRRVKQEPGQYNEFEPKYESSFNGIPSNVQPGPPQPTEDPTLGCTLNTSFPVARIKRIMQADEDIGKVAQVTPTVVSRALELFMIKLISSSAHQARGPATGGVSKGPKRVLQQHLKKAVLADEKFDFLNEIVDKVPDAPAKGKKENGSDSEDAKPKKRSKKRKDSGDDF